MTNGASKLRLLICYNSILGIAFNKAEVTDCYAKNVSLQCCRVAFE